MQFVTKEQIDQFYVRFKGQDVVGMQEMLAVFQEVFDYPLPVSMISQEDKKKITKSIFMNPNVIQDLREAANETELIEDEDEFMRVIHEV